MRFSRQEYWSGLLFLSPGDLPDPGFEPRSPALWADSLQSELPGKPPYIYTSSQKRSKERNMERHFLLLLLDLCLHLRWHLLGFLGGPAVKNLPPNTGDMVSIPGGGKIPHARVQLSSSVPTTEAWAPRACALQQEKPLQWEARTQQRRVKQQRPSVDKNRLKNFLI